MALIFDRGEVKLIGDHIMSLFAPSRMPDVPDTYAGLEASDLRDWSRDSLSLLIEEGRRRLDAANARFESIRDRSQYVMAASLATTGIVVGFVEQAVEHLAFFLVWSLIVALVLLSFVVAFAAFASTARLGSVDPVLFSRQSEDSDVERIRSLARAYVSAVRLSTSAVNVRFTLYRDSIWLLVAGVVVAITAWGVRSLDV